MSHARMQRESYSDLSLAPNLTLGAASEVLFARADNCLHFDGSLGSAR